MWLQMWGMRKNVLNHCFPTQIFNVFFRYWYVGGICLFKNTGRRENSSGTAAKSSNVDQVRIKKYLLFSLAKKKRICSGCLCFHVIFWIVCHVFELKFKEFKQGHEFLFLTLLLICVFFWGVLQLNSCFYRTLFLSVAFPL